MRIMKYIISILLFINLGYSQWVNTVGGEYNSRNEFHANFQDNLYHAIKIDGPTTIEIEGQSYSFFSEDYNNYCQPSYNGDNNSCSAILLIKYKSDGTVEWARYIESIWDLEPRASLFQSSLTTPLHVDNNGNIFIAIEFSGTIPARTSFVTVTIEPLEWLIASINNSISL